MQPQPMVPTTGSTRNAAANAAPEDGLVSAGAKSALSAELLHTGSLEIVGSKIRTFGSRAMGMARTGGRRVPWRIYPIRVPYTVRGTRYHAVRHPTRSSFYLGRVE
jgi:hypothetical protein